MLQITICEMGEKPSGGFQRKKCTQPLEITTACRSDTYLSFAQKAAAALNIKPPSNSSSSMSLQSDRRCQDCRVWVDNKRRSTSLDPGQLPIFAEKSSANVQIGVAYTREEPLSDECFSDDSEADVS